MVEIDLDDGDYWASLSLAQDYRAETLAFVEDCLGLRETSGGHSTSNKSIESFDVIGEALQSCWSPSKCSSLI